MTLAMPYYENPQMLKLHLGYWKRYDPFIKRGLVVVLVDDGSQNNSANGVLEQCGLPDFELQLYRVKENIPWNFRGARNLALKKAPDGWVISVDIDHVIPSDSMMALWSLPLDPKCYYIPDRYNVTNGAAIRCKRHGDAYILTKSMFWRVGGFDEAYTGYYGAPHHFHHALDKKATRVDLDSVYLLHFSNEIEDASTRDFDRNHRLEDVPELKRRKEKQRKNYNSVEPLQFEWERVL